MTSPSEMYVRMGIPIPMADGVELVADIALPAESGPFPCLLQRVPYDRDSPGIRNGALDVGRAVRRGYAVVTQDCRGRYGSGGDFTPFVREADDGADTVAWIASQPWCDGSVAMFGRSYSAVVQWLAAARRPPALRAIAPMFSGADPLVDWFHPTGLLEWGFLVLWTARYLAPDALARAGWPVPAEELFDTMDDLDELLAGRDGGKRLARIAEHVPFLRAWLDELDSGLPSLAGIGVDPATIEVPVFLIGGWFDLFLTGTLRSHARRVAAAPERPTSLLVGPWPHGGPSSGAYPEHDFGVRAGSEAIGLTDQQLAWFDRWCRGATGSADPPVRFFVTGEDRWRVAPSWPPPGTTPIRFSWAADEPDRLALRLSGPAPDAATVTLAYDRADPVRTRGGQTFLPGLDVSANSGPRDQRSLLGRPDVIASFSEVLDQPLEVIGAPLLTISVDDHLPSASIVGRLVERHPDGRVMLLGEGAGFLVAGTAEVTLPPVAHRFDAGSAVGLLLSATSVPRFRCWDADGQRPNGSMRLELGRSALVLPCSDDPTPPPTEGPGG